MRLTPVGGPLKVSCWQPVLKPTAASALTPKPRWRALPNGDVLLLRTCASLALRKEKTIPLRRQSLGAWRCLCE